MDDPRHVAWADAVLRRPAVDPDIPRADRVLLTSPGTLLTPASRTRPARTRDYLPADPGKREATIEGAVIGLVAAGGVAVGGTTPLAIGVLVFQGPVGWQSASSHVALILAEIIAIVTAVIFGTRMIRFGQLNGQVPAEVAARAYHGRYLTGADFDARSRVLLRRAQDAVDVVTSAAVYQAGFLDAPAATAALADQEWDIAVALREQARLRAQRAELSMRHAGAVTAALLKRHSQAAQLADSSVAARVAALERYAAQVREADAAYRDWQQAAALAELGDQHLDLLARTAADEHGIAEIEAMSQQARAVYLALRQPGG
jgi:hypothetical protein